MHLIAQSGRIQDESYEKAMSKMMKGLRKTIAKDMSEKGERVIKGKGHMSFKCCPQICNLLIKDCSPDSAFASFFFNIAMESYFTFRSNRKYNL